MNEKQTSFDKLKDDVHYLIVAHCKYKDMSMYERALKQFQKDIDYGQLEEMSYNERFAFLIGFEKSLLTIDKLNVLNEQSKNEKMEITYEKAIYDILCTLPAGTTWISREGIEEIVIRIKKRILLEVMEENNGK
nr:MAG TPA: hypothetical protein [Caudoviricetes sp.]